MLRWHNSQRAQCVRTSVRLMFCGFQIPSSMLCCVFTYHCFLQHSAWEGPWGTERTRPAVQPIKYTGCFSGWHGRQRVLADTKSNNWDTDSSVCIFTRNATARCYFYTCAQETVAYTCYGPSIAEGWPSLWLLKSSSSKEELQRKEGILWWVDSDKQYRRIM